MNWHSKLQEWTANAKLKEWIADKIKLCKPKDVYFCNGSESEYEQLIEIMVKNATVVRLNSKIRPNSVLARSDPADVARVESRTFICSKDKRDAGPTNNWYDPSKMKEKLSELFAGCMLNRTMYIIPYSMGPIDSDLSHIGIEITDSPYVVCSMHIMARVSPKVLDKLGERGEFIPGIHSVGMPLSDGQKDVPWPCCPESRYIVHFPESKSIWSYGSGYGGNALLGKKCFALRIASILAKEQGWFAEHMLIVGVTNPQGEKKYFAAAFPSACGKTNLAMMNATLNGWKIECVGDDIAWMRFDEEGNLRAINPENGFFGVAPGTSFASNPNAMYTMDKNAIFTNVALSDEKDVWWEGMNDDAPHHLQDWLFQNWSTQLDSKAAHPNARFTAPARQCPTIDPNWEDPKGVIIEGLIFGGRRASKLPLVFEAMSWNHGVFLGASVSSEMTAAAEGAVGKLRHDPFAMLPFCGYHMGDYFQHWIEMGKKAPSHKLPKIFYVNWFRKDEANRYLWPGFGENCRVLKWMFESLQGKNVKQASPLGFLPQKHSIDLSELTLSEKRLEQLFYIDRSEWLEEISGLKKYFLLFEDRFPQELQSQLEELEKRIIDFENF